MDYRKRKIFSRIGAAFLLGMSLFNLGALWGKQKKGTLPRRSKQTRKQTQEEMDKEMQSTVKMVEEEATQAMKEILSQKEEIGQAVKQQQTVFQRIVIYASVGAWAIAAGVLFSSAIFNQPFGLGKGMLSLLPGNPHLAVISLELSNKQKVYSVGEVIKMKVKVDSAGEKVDFLRLVLNYDQQVLKLKDLKTDFSSIKENKNNPLAGKINLALKLNKAQQLRLKENSVVEFDFLTTHPKKNPTIKVDQGKSLVLKSAKVKKGAKENILGKVKVDKFTVRNKTFAKIDCLKVGNKNLSQKNDWKDLQNGPPSEQRAFWYNLKQSEETAFRCVQNNRNERYLFIAHKRPLVAISLEGEKNKFIQKANQFKLVWQEQGRFFTVVKLDQSSLEKVKLKLEDYKKEELFWP